MHHNSANYKEILISNCDKHNDIGPQEDGFQYFWARGRGALSAADLRIIADELDKRNADWATKVKRNIWDGY